MSYLVLLQYYEHMWCTMRRHSDASWCEPITSPDVGVLSFLPICPNDADGTSNVHTYVRIR